MFTLTTQTNVWHPCHRVETRDADFAHLLYEQALEIDIEPEFERLRNGAFAVEFVADNALCDAAITDAIRLLADKGAAHPACVVHVQRA